MQCVIRHARIPQPKPNTFAGLMEMYENNYIKIRKLCGNFDNLGDILQSEVAEGMNLYLQVVERTPYTVIINLTYKFSKMNNQRPKMLPDVFVKVYFDAMQAEVLTKSSVTHSGQTQKYGDLADKWRDNRFLYKWLSFCIAQGHTFIAGD